jgi:predicted flap endonuclease-1-like 5' DNA nuclease
MNILAIEGIGKTYAKKLKAAGINTTEALLKSAATKKDRHSLSEKTGISETLILEWANLSDLFRIKGVGEEYSDLIEEAGVDTIKELRRRNPENLYQTILEINEKKNLVNRVPSQSMVEDWIQQAKKMTPVITY